jgi:hypothetical protein
MISIDATAPIAPYRGDYVMDCFNLNIGMEDFFTQAALAVENYVSHRDGKKRKAPVSRAGPLWGVILLYVGEEGRIMQKSVDLKDVPLTRVFLRQFGFNSLDCECRLYSADFILMGRKEPLTAPRLLKTSWSCGLPVFWALTSRSVFYTTNHDHKAYIPQDVRFNLGPLYKLPHGTLGYMYRSVHTARQPERDENEHKLPQIFNRFETKAFSCDVYKYCGVNSEGVDGCVLSEPHPRWPIFKPRSEGPSAHPGAIAQGAIAQKTSEEFHDYILSTFLGDVREENRTYAQLVMLLTLDEEDLAELLTKVTPCGYSYVLLTHILHAPWFVTRNLYFARKGTIMPLGADEWTLGHNSDSVLEHLGRQAFMIPERRNWCVYEYTMVEDTMTDVYQTRRRCADGLKLESDVPNNLKRKGTELVLWQRERAFDAIADFDDERRETLEETPPEMNLRMVISSFSYARVELHSYKHKQRTNTLTVTDEGKSCIVKSIQEIISILSS